MSEKGIPNMSYQLAFITGEFSFKDKITQLDRKVVKLQVRLLTKQNVPYYQEYMIDADEKLPVQPGELWTIQAVIDEKNMRAIPVLIKKLGSIEKDYLPFIK